MFRKNEATLRIPPGLRVKVGQRGSMTCGPEWFRKTNGFIFSGDPENLVGFPCWFGLNTTKKGYLKETFPNGRLVFFGTWHLCFLGFGKPTGQPFRHCGGPKSGTNKSPAGVVAIATAESFGSCQTIVGSEMPSGHGNPF